MTWIQDTRIPLFCDYDGESIERIPEKTQREHKILRECTRENIRKNTGEDTQVTHAEHTFAILYSYNEYSIEHSLLLEFRGK